MAKKIPDTAAKSPTSQVLYRKYRPTELKDVVGQSQITTMLSNALKQGKIAHAYLFIGPRGTGKTSVARIFAHAVNGFEYQVEDSYLDIIEIDAASNTGVDNIRDLREKAVIAPSKGKYKVYIIDEVHMLTKSAANALLKTLEEPPEHVIFIMATTDAHKIPITISSRAQVYTFKLAQPEVMQAHLRQIADREGIKITDDALEIVVRRGGGSFRDSLSLLDQIASLSEDEITAAALGQALGLPQSQTIQELLQAYHEQNTTTIHDLLQSLLDSGVKPEIIASELITSIMDNPQPDFIGLLRPLTEVQPPFPEAKLLLALLAPVSTPVVPPKAISNQPTPTPVTPAKAPESQSRPVPPSHPTPTPKPAKTPSTTPREQNARVETTISEAEKAPEEAPNPPVSTADFSWENFLEQVHDVNEAIHSQLLHVQHDLQADTLHLYPDKKFVKNILDKAGNRQIMAKFLPNISLVIHDPDATQPPEDSQISQISAIMGTVKEVDGEMPF